MFTAPARYSRTARIQTAYYTRIMTDYLSQSQFEAELQQELARREAGSAGNPIKVLYPALAKTLLGNPNLTKQLTLVVERPMRGRFDPDKQYLPELTELVYKGATELRFDGRTPVRFVLFEDLVYLRLDLEASWCFRSREKKLLAALREWLTSKEYKKAPVKNGVEYEDALLGWDRRKLVIHVPGSGRAPLTIKDKDVLELMARISIPRSRRPAQAPKKASRSQPHFVTSAYVVLNAILLLIMATLIFSGIMFALSILANINKSYTQPIWMQATAVLVIPATIVYVVFHFLDPIARYEHKRIEYLIGWHQHRLNTGHPSLDIREHADERL